MRTDEEYFLEALQDEKRHVDEMEKLHDQVYHMQRGVLTSKIGKEVCWTSSLAKVKHSDGKENFCNKNEGSTKKLKDKDTPTKNNEDKEENKSWRKLSQQEVDILWKDTHKETVLNNEVEEEKGAGFKGRLDGPQWII